MAVQLKSQWRAFGGYLRQYTHFSRATQTNMTFSVYLPPAAGSGKRVPLLWYLSGLTCTDENFCQKAGAQRAAAKAGIALVAPDTSPRGANIEGENDAYDFGTGAGFYIDATQAPWNSNYRMYTYITEELSLLVKEGMDLPVDPSREGIFGHSMGGHGALTLAMKNPSRFKSVSAFSPICNPTQCAWGQKAFTGYLGGNQKDWEAHDATMLMEKSGPYAFPILISQGDADQFLKENQLRPEPFLKACESKGQNVTYKSEEGYDHSYYFISTFVDEHIEFHAKHL